LYTITKKSYTKKRKGERTSIALDPEMTKRLDKVLGDKKLSEFAREVINKELEVQETKQTLKKFEKLGDSGQYQKIKRLETDIESLKKDHVSFEKELKYFREEYAHEEKYEKHGQLEKSLAEGRRETPELWKILDDNKAELDKKLEEYSKKIFMEGGKYTEQDWKEFQKDKAKTIKKYKEKKNV